MTPGARTDCTYSIVFAGSVRCPDLGRDVVAAHLGLTTQEAARRLAAAPSVLAKALAPEAARRLVTLLRLLGLPAGCEPEPTLAQASCALTFDLAIQPTANAPAADIAGYLAKRLNRPEASFLSLLQAPGGLVVQNLTWPSASAWRSDKWAPSASWDSGWLAPPPCLRRCRSPPGAWRPAPRRRHERCGNCGW